VHCRSTDYGAPSSSTGHRPTHLRRGSDRLIGAVQKIGHEETWEWASIDGETSHSRQRPKPSPSRSTMVAATMNPNGKSSRSWRSAPSASGRSRSQSEHPGSSLIHQTIERMFGQIQITATHPIADLETRQQQLGLKPNYSSERPVLLVLCSTAHLENHQAAPLDPSTMSSKGPAFRTIPDCLPTISNVREQTGQARLQRANKHPSCPNHPIPNSAQGQIARSSSEPNNPSRHRAFVHGVNDSRRTSIRSAPSDHSKTHRAASMQIT
ncbi:hypothetical protein ACLOJK_039164, partial [Asimina triloba]